MTDKQPEALRLADDLEILEDTIGDGICKEAAAELRRLYALNQELLEALNYASAESTEDHVKFVARAAIAKAQEQA